MVVMGGSVASAPVRRPAVKTAVLGRLENVSVQVNYPRPIGAVEEVPVNILVLGVGNLLLSDEGVGVRALEEIQQRLEIPAGVELLDGGTSGMELLGYIQGRDALIILDAVTCNKPAGTIIRLEGDQVPALFRKKISPHQLGISDLIAAARLTDSLPGKVVLFGIQPELLDTGLELSDRVAAALDELTGMVALELEALGVPIALKTKARSAEARHDCFAIAAG
jgi:hydrogenase maturation protease